MSRDLETICLKCLEKNASRRYIDCGALANDLQRFLNSEPITARRIGPMERTIRWLKNEPKLTAALVGAFIAMASLIGVLFVSDQTQRDLAAKIETEAKEKNEALGSALTAAQAQVKANQTALMESKTRALHALTAAYSSDFQAIVKAQESGNFDAADRMQHDTRPELAGWEWSLMQSLQNQKRQTIFQLKAGAFDGFGTVTTLPPVLANRIRRYFSPGR